MKAAKFLILGIICGLAINFLTGCATAPLRENIPAYNLNHTTYYPLVVLCQLRGIDYQYDSFGRTVILNKDNHRINLRVGDALVLVDGRAQLLDAPVDIYQGAIVVPYKFKETILDVLFKKVYPVSRPSAPFLKIKKIVIDPGHGGSDPGAIGRTGLREKDINLDLAKRLSNILKSYGVKVTMTRSSDRFIPLSTRVEIANSSQADIFISIHANANRVRSLNGFEVYYVAPSVDDSRRAYSAARDDTLHLDNASFASHSLNLKAILWDMSYTNSRAEAIELAHSLCRAMNENLGTRILGVKGGRFLVLKGVQMPGVLIEVGFLSNSDEERKLKNSYYRQKIAESIALGLKDYDRDVAIMEDNRG